jgi:hypothetical protein
MSNIKMKKTISHENDKQKNIVVANGCSPDSIRFGFSGYERTEPPHLS